MNMMFWETPALRVPPGGNQVDGLPPAQIEQEWHGSALLRE